MRESIGCKKGCCKEIEPDVASFTSVWHERPTNHNETGHPCSYPINLVRRCLLAHKGMVVLDPFMGSGTTAIACIKEHRNFIGFELNKEYFDKANKRIQNEQSQLNLF